jgi:hypothetical protein
VKRLPHRMLMWLQMQIFLKDYLIESGNSFRVYIILSGLLLTSSVEEWQVSSEKFASGLRNFCSPVGLGGQVTFRK